jgi:hypothetical protein
MLPNDGGFNRRMQHLDSHGKGIGTGQFRLRLHMDKKAVPPRDNR